MKGRKSGAVTMFLGLFLIVVFFTGMAVDNNPNALMRSNSYNMALEHFGIFCAAIWLPAGIIGFPLFLFSLILSLIREWKKGYEVVYAVRKERDGESWFKKWTASAFYRLIDKIADVRIPLDTGDFRLYDRKVVNVMKQMPERNRFLRGMSSWVGFKQTGVEYHREERYAGTTHYPLKKMLKLALTAITGFSTVPLQLATWLGFGITGLSVLAFIIDLIARGENGTAISVFFMGGVLLIILGIIGEYIGRIYDEVRSRPLYVTREITKSVYDKTEENQ